MRWNYAVTGVATVFALHTLTATHVWPQEQGRERSRLPDTKPWPAPVGHRQPTAADVRAIQQDADAEKAREQRNREIDSKLKICATC